MFDSRAASGKAMTVSEYSALKALCLASYADFVREFWDEVVSGAKLKWNFHLDEMAKICERVMYRVKNGLPREFDYVINVPPGSTKSTIMSIMFPAWAFTVMPNCQMICSSHTEKLSWHMSQQCRDLIKSEKFRKTFPYIQVRDDQDTKGFFKLDSGGWRLAIGNSGNPVGFHGHILISDDPINPTEAVSETQIAQVNHWMENSFYSRKLDKSVTTTILIQQRLAEDDPSGRLLAKKKDKIYHLKLPSTTEFDVYPPELKEKYTPVAGEVYAYLDPDRIGPEACKDARVDLGDVGYAGQHGQEPAPAEGAMFKIDKLRAETLGGRKIVRQVRFWDKAGTLKGGAFTVGLKMGMDDEGRWWVLDVIREQLDSGRRERLILDTAKKDGRDVIIGLEQEPGSGGKESAEGTARRLVGFRVKIIKPTGDKTVRADEFSSQVNAGNVSLLLADWNTAYKQELKYFPNSKYKDQVDASSGAFSVLQVIKKRVGALKGRAA